MVVGLEKEDLDLVSLGKLVKLQHRLVEYLNDGQILPPLSMVKMETTPRSAAMCA